MIGDLSISAISSLIIAFSALLGVLLAYVVVARILRQQSLVNDSLSPIQDRKFHSKDEAWRATLEKQIADLNERLTDRVSEFRDVNHLLLDAESGTFAVNYGQELVHSPFLAGMDIPPLEIEDDLIFVLTPFEKREEATFAAIVEAFQSWNVRVLRGDEENISSNILRHIISMLSRANVVIANVSTRNPNVMYELGIAQALGKRVLMVSRTIDDVPFDLRHQRILLYTTREDLISKLRESVGGILLAGQKHSS